MDRGSSDSETDNFSQLDYYFSPTSDRAEEEQEDNLSPRERFRREQERLALIKERVELHRKEFNAFVRAKPVA